jgi:predicted dehydrogenase
MRIVVVGLGVQGRKRLAVAGPDVVATVDPVSPDARYQAIEHVPLDVFEAALVCTPDQAKADVLTYLLSHGKHVLVEKPLLVADEERILELAAMARTTGVACYTAYNHRFEPHLARLKMVLDQGAIGTVYLMRGAYGNGTAQDVKRSSWRDEGLGVLSDLGSHLLDLVLFLVGEPEGHFQVWNASCFETRAFDHVLFGTTGKPVVELEASLVSWRNAFTLEVFGDLGSAHIDGLCKWGPSRLTIRRRVFPSGRPHEETQMLECADPTWKLEYQHFTRLCHTGGTNLENDRWIHGVLTQLATESRGAVSTR